MLKAPLVTIGISALVTPRYTQRLISELAHQHPPKPQYPFALTFDTVMIIACTIIALPMLTFGATCMSAVLTNYHIDIFGSPFYTAYSLNPLWATLGAGFVAALAHKTYHTESDKLVVILTMLLNIAITVPSAPLASAAADAALKVIDGQPMRQSVNQAIGTLRLPSTAVLASSVIFPLALAIFILHEVVADGVIRGHQAHEHWKEIKADDLTRDLDGNPVSPGMGSMGLSEQKVYDVITGQAMAML